MTGGSPGPADRGRRAIPRRILPALALIAVLAGLGWAATRSARDARFVEVIGRARALASRGRFDEARRILTVLPDWRLADPEAADLLGTCEHAAGRFEEAITAWSRIPPGSDRARSGAMARARTLAGDLGRFADAEAVLESSFREPGPGRLDLAHTLAQLYFLESRPEAMRRLIRATWREWTDPASELRDLWLIDDATVMVDEVRRSVEVAEARAPDDDRVRLARAGLDLLTGRLDEAARRVDDCLRRQPEDPAVWLASLRLARAREDARGVRLALGHLPADALREADLLDLRAWLAGLRGDVEDRRRTLERRIEVEPVDPRALEWLAAMEWEAGHRDRAAGLRRRKKELDDAKDRYRRLLVDHPPTSRFEELATLAETLDRPFEAYGWWSHANRLGATGPAVAEGMGRLRGRIESPPATVPGTLAGRLDGLLATGRPATDPGVARSPVYAPPAVAFTDDAGPAGLRFTFEAGRTRERQLPETTGGGVGVLDYDGDGRLDVFAVQGGTFPPDSSRPGPGDRLFRNRGDGTFEDATDRSGIARMARGYGHGIAVGDVDNDGDPDLFLTRFGSYALYRNRGDGTFEDATKSMGLGGDRGWPTSAAFADLDGDGDLDLYVCHYVEWDARNPTLCPRTPPAGEAPDPARPYGYCMPHRLVASPDRLFRNDGGKFVNASAEAGIVDRDGRGLGVVAVNVDDDGRLDLFVANDTTANYLFRNRGGLRFEEEGLTAGVACNADGAYQAGMGTAAGDLDGDGRVDLAVTNFYGESTTFFRNLGDGMFGDQTAAIGLSAPSRYLLGFGVAFLDANDDGRLDLATANGHVNDDRPRYPYAMPAQILLGVGGGRVVDVSRAAGPPWSVPRIGRGLAIADLDNDGRVNLLISAQDGPMAFFRNRSQAGRSTTIRLEGTASDRDAVGARVSLVAGGRRQVSRRIGGGSFQSASDPRLHFGLGDADRIEEIEVRWPSGRVDRHRDLATGAGYHLREGDPTPRPLPGFGPGR